MPERFLSFNEVLRKKFPFKVRKIPLDAGFTCPNRDGTKARGGCLYCENRSFSPNATGPLKSLEEQMLEGVARLKTKGVDHVIAYFQAYTNTYAPLDELRRRYDRALSFPGVVALAVGTRPDCVSESVLELLESYGSRIPVWLELGLESSHDRTLERVNRAHTYEEFVAATERAKGRGLELAAHLIYGFPGESHDDMMLTTDRIASLGLDAVKIHHLYVAKNTVFEEWHRQDRIPVMSFEEWISLAADILERLPPETAIERTHGELSNDYLIAPRWGKSAGEVIRSIDAELARRGSRQGSRYQTILSE